MNQLVSEHVKTIASPMASLLFVGCGAASHDVPLVCDPETGDCSDPCDSEAVRWTAEDVEGGADHNDEFALAVEQDGRVHLAYYVRTEGEGGRAIHHASSEGSGWDIEEVGLGEYPSQALGPDGAVHLTFVHDPVNSAELVYATSDGRGDWHSEVLAVGVGKGRVAVDPEGTVQVLYSSVSGGYTLATRVSAGRWVTESVTLGENPTAVMDERGALHVAFETEAGIRYATNASGTWVAETAAPNGRTVFRIALALDEDERPLLAYDAQDGSGIFYASRDDAWHQEPVTSPASPHDSLALTLEREGQVNLIYRDYHTSELVDGARVKGRWLLPVIDTVEDRVITGLATGGGRVHLGYAGWSEGQVRYLSRPLRACSEGS